MHSANLVCTAIRHLLRLAKQIGGVFGSAMITPASNAYDKIVARFLSEIIVGGLEIRLHVVSFSGM